MEVYLEPVIEPVPGREKDILISLSSFGGLEENGRKDGTKIQIPITLYVRSK